MIANTSWKDPADNGLPQVLILCPLTHIAPNNPSLGSKKSFVSGASDDIRSFPKGFLKIGPDQSQNMGHVIVDDRPGFHFRYHLSNLFQRFSINNHAFAQNDQ